MKLCLYGDGANWIRAGLEYLPNCVFVLDPYHFSLGLPDPDRVVSLPARSGKVTLLFNALRSF